MRKFGRGGGPPGRRRGEAPQAPGRRSQVQLRGLRSREKSPDPEEAHQTAERGASGAGGPLPHRERIAESFGAHADHLDGVRAHVGGEAAAAAESLGAEAYATGDDVAFASPPDLHTAAHEAAHVVQQSGGVELKGGIGTPGDAHEQHADAVADRVVRGQGASDLLSSVAPASSGRAARRKALQHKIKEDLREAMEGWGTDEDAIFRRLERASLPELQAVTADKALMSELRSELNQSDMSRVLDLIRAPLADKLRLAMAGWGTDEDYIHRSIANASAAELQAVASDPALVSRLRSELSGDELKSVLDRIKLPLDQKLRHAVSGWGTDEGYIFRSIREAPVMEVLIVASDEGLISRVDGDLSGDDLHRFRGLLAQRLYKELALPVAAFGLCMGSDEARAARLRWVGALDDQRALCDQVITISNDGDEVIQAFQSYWGVETTTRAGATNWPPATVKHIHESLKVLPDQDTRSGVWRELALTSKPSLINRAAWSGSAGRLVVGSNASTTSTSEMGHGTTLGADAKAGDDKIRVTEPARFAKDDTIALDRGGPNEDVAKITSVSGDEYTLDTPLSHDHSAGDDVTPDDDSAIRDVNWLAATVRHEIAHSVETALGGVTGFTEDIGGWWTGKDFDTWAGEMSDPWATSDGSEISDADKKKIKDTITDAVKNQKGSLFGLGLPADHPIEQHKRSGVPVIVAAEACLSQGDSFYQDPTALYASNGKRFSVSFWYKKFMYHNEEVVAQRVADYQLYAPAEFFAEAYTVFYEEAGKPDVSDEDYGRLIRNSRWRQWIRENIHERGQAPAGAGAGGGASPSGASFGKSSGNPGP